MLDVEKEFSELRKRVEKIEKEMHRLEMLERMQAQHEIVLAKKIADINRFDSELRKILREIVREEDLDDMRNDLKKLEQHDAVLVENTKFIHEIIHELDKVKELHKLNKQHMLEKRHVSHDELEEKFDDIKEALSEVEDVRTTHKKKAGRDELESIRKELHERMAQLEYQNKLLMSYLKKVDEALQNKF
jgi:hypothetical protein